MSQVYQKVAKSIGSLYTDRWRMGTKDTTMHNNVCHIVCGPPAAGKTTISKELYQLLNGKMLLDSDVLSTRLIEAGLSLNGMNKDDRDSTLYKKTYRDPVYETMYDIVNNNFESQSTTTRNRKVTNHVVLCGPFTSECRDIEWLSKLRKRLNYNCHVEVHYVSCNDDVRRSRMIQRNEPRDSTKLLDDDSWNQHCLQASRQRPLFPHHYKDNSLSNDGMNEESKSL